MLRASVVVPTFNRRPSLAVVLQSLERQTAAVDRFEVVVVLDGCTDDSEDWLRQYRPPYRLRFCRQPNGGLAAARNLGAREAEHELLIFLDDDVVADPGLVAAHLAAHETQPNLLVEGYMPTPPDWSRRGAILLYASNYEETVGEAPGAGPLNRDLWSGNISVRRDTFDRIGGFDPHLFRRYGGEDTDFSLRAEALGVELRFEPRALGGHHQADRRYASVARQAFTEGASRVRLTRRHDLNLARFPGCTPRIWTDRLVISAWRLPWLAERCGAAPIGLLWLADRVAPARARVLAAKIVARYYRLGGIACAQREPWPPEDASLGQPALSTAGPARQ